MLLFDVRRAADGKPSATHGQHQYDHTKLAREINTMAFGGGISCVRGARAIAFASGIGITLAVAGIGGDSNADASEPGWSPVVIATGEYRESIKSIPIEARPYRPLHFYGNTRRRIHHRGTPLPVVGAIPDDLRGVTPRRSAPLPTPPQPFLRGR